MARRTAGIENKNSGYRKGIKEKLTEALELPKELILDFPKITVVGSRDMIIENYKGVMEYASERVRVNTGIGVVKITGNGLRINEITSECIILSGEIYTFEFASAG